MQQKPFEKLFGNIVDEQTALAFAGAIVNYCDVDTVLRSVDVEIAVNGFIEQSAMAAFENSVKQALKLNELTVHTVELGAFAQETFENEKAENAEFEPEEEYITEEIPLPDDAPAEDEAYLFVASDNTDTSDNDEISETNDQDLDAILAEVKEKIGVAGGFLIGAKVELSGDTATVILTNGGVDMIKSSNFEMLFCKAVKSKFGIDCSVEYGGKTDFEQIEAPKTEVAETVKDQPKRQKIDTSVPPTDGLPVYLKSAQRFYGSNLKKNITRIKDIIFPENDYETLSVSVFGEVFNCDLRVINT
ncbi:MAG: hypothetical protein KBS41_04210, partial [Oscillospiraceae bacterium]|nr:hypothetical protein [Candidatus Equicaccousia limihippi]